MGGDTSFWGTSTTPYEVGGINSLLNGMYQGRGAGTNGYFGLDPTSGEQGYNRALIDEDNGPVGWSAGGNYNHIQNFGGLRAAWFAYNRKDRAYPGLNESQGTDAEQGIHFIKGPFNRAGARLMPSWESRLTGLSSMALYGADAAPLTVRTPDALIALLKGALDTITPEVDTLANVLGMAADGTNGFAALFGVIAGSGYDIAAITAGTIDPPSFSPGTVPSAPTVSAPSTITAPTVSAPSTITAPTVTTPAALSAITVTSPNPVTPGTIAALSAITAVTEPTALAEITAPTIVTVTAAIDAAVNAHAALKDVRFTAEESQLRQTLAAGRAVMTTQFDASIAFLNGVVKEAENDDYDAQLRVEQAKMNGQLADSYQERTFARNRENVGFVAKFKELLLSAQQVNAGSQAKTAELGLQRARAQVEIDAQSGMENTKVALEANLRQGGFTFDKSAKDVEFLLTKESKGGEFALQAAAKDAELSLQADIKTKELAFETAAKNAELSLQADMKNAEFVIARTELQVRYDAMLLQFQDLIVRRSTAQVEAAVRAGIAYGDEKVNMMTARLGMVKVIYDVVIAWINAKAHLISNAGAVAGVIATGVESELKESQYNRAHRLDYNKTKIELESMVSQNIAASAELRWKAVIQNMMVVKEAMSTFGQAGGTESHPGTFAQVSQAMGGLFSAASGIMTLVNLIT